MGDEEKGAYNCQIWIMKGFEAKKFRLPYKMNGISTFFYISCAYWRKKPHVLGIYCLRQEKKQVIIYIYIITYIIHIIFIYVYASLFVYIS